MRLKLSMIVMLILFIRCRAETATVSPVELLTRLPWILSSYGVDENENGMIDTIEESIADCEKYNLYHFYKNGTGVFWENQLNCATGITDLAFTWKLVNNNSSLDFHFVLAGIQRLTVDELIICHDEPIGNNRSMRYILVFRH